MSRPETSLAFVAGAASLVVAVLLAFAPGVRRSTPCQLAVLTVTGMVVLTAFGCASFDGYRRIDALEVGCAFTIPILAWRLPGAPERSRAASALLFGLAALSVVAIVDAAGATELLTGHMTGVGVSFVFGFFPAVPVYCLRPSLFPLLLAAAVIMSLLVIVGRSSRTATRFTLVAGLLVAASFLTRDLHECVASPYLAASSLFSKGLHAY